jgi:hypothetical protein
MQRLWVAAFLSMVSIPSRSRMPLETTHGASKSPTIFELRGVVRVEATGQAIAGAVVSVESLSKRHTVTDANGSYRLDSLPLGAYTIDARRLGYYVERREIAVHCPIAIVDSAGRPLRTNAGCDSDQQILNFHMRPQTLR